LLPALYYPAEIVIELLSRRRNIGKIQAGKVQTRALKLSDYGRKSMFGK
jgi:hypothetical protein